MSTCTAAEIAEKRRIALEKLRAKQANIAASTSNGSVSTNTTQANSFKAALNALKQGSKSLPRPTNHPYERPKKFQQQKAVSTNATPKLAPVFTSSISCKPYVISPNCFAIATSGYHAQLIEVFKTIPSKSYDNNTRIWSFALKDYQLVHDRVEAMKPDVTIGSIPKKVLNLCNAPAKQIDSSCLVSIETKLVDKLLPFQQEGVCFAISQNGRLMICDEMGLGKTYQALAVADFYREDWPLLICTTASTRESWSSHIRELLPSLPVQYVQVLSSNDQYFGDAKVVILSYALLGNNIEKLVERKFNTLIFDESHQLKNSKAKCSRAAERLARIARHVILLSGTPALSRPLELFTQLHLIDPTFMTFMEFTARYCDGKQTHFGWDANGQSNLQELNVILKLKFMIRRTKADVLPELSEKNRETVILNPALVWTNDETKNTLNKFAKDFSASKGKQKEEILLHFYAQTAAVKTRAVCSYLKSLIKENKKFIVFAHHRIMLDAICSCLNELHVNYIRIDGQTKNETRAEYIEKFQMKTECKVAVLSLRACNSGITLTAAEMIIFAELDWNPSTLAQAESRAHRIGQDKKIVCRYLMATKTADDFIWNMLKNKQDVLKSAGLFCENLQNATHTAVPTISNNIERYFSPDKSLRSINEKDSNLPIKEITTTEIVDKCSSREENSKQIIAELENVEDLFKDDDVFKDILS